MDLRSRQLSERQLATTQKLIFDGLLGYQPFIFHDNLETGVGYEFEYDAEGAGLAYWPSCPQEQLDKSPELRRLIIDPKIAEDFRNANRRLRITYTRFMEMIVEKLGSLKGLSVADVGCNTGYFAQMAAQRGAAKVRAYDAVNYSPSFQLLNEILGTKVEFVHSAYEQKTATLPGAEPADLVISVAVLCHMSEPLRHLALLGSLAKKALFVWTLAVPSQPEEKLVRYRAANRYYVDAQFPHSFDLVEMSAPLLEFSLRSMGFKELHPVIWREGGITRKVDETFCGFLAIR